MIIQLIMYIHQLQCFCYFSYNKMQTGIAAVIIICVAIILVLLFYMVTRYFNYRLQKSLENQTQVYSMVQGLEVNLQDLRDGQYEDFAQSRVKQWQKKDDNGNILFMDLNQQGALKNSLFQTDNDIYGKQDQYLDFSRDSMKILPQSSRSAGSLKRFQVQKLSDFRQNSSISNQNKSQLSSYNNTNRQSSQNFHNFISQIVLYKDNEIYMIKNVVTSIFKSRVTQQVLQKRYIIKKRISKSDVHFIDTIEAYGFQEKVEGAYKFTTVVTIPNMKYQNHYTIKQYKQSQRKQQISFAQFEQLTQILQQI